MWKESALYLIRLRSPRCSSTCLDAHNMISISCFTCNQPSHTEQTRAIKVGDDFGPREVLFPSKMCRVSNCRIGKVTLLPSTNKTETRPAKRGFHFAWPKEEDITQARHHHREKSLKKKPLHTSISCGSVTMSNHVVRRLTLSLFDQR